MSFLINTGNGKKGRVLEFFLNRPTREVHLRELARLVGISFPWVRKLTAELAKQAL